MTKWLHPLPVLALLGLLYFGNLVVHPGRTLYSEHSDLLPLHLPSKFFLVRSWQESGAVPLWCPHSFSGLPFVHDPQATIFYPPHWPLMLLPAEDLEGWLGAALSWLVVLHVLAAGGCMYAYARSRELQPFAAGVAALGYMFAGKWLIHVLYVGHYNMIPLAWLPLVVLWLEQALRQGSLVRATWAGATFSLLILGAYPYVTLYAGLFVALWTLGPALERAGYLGAEGGRSRQRTLGALGVWLGMGVWTALVGSALGAVQLLPGLEASAHATRGLGVEASGQMLRGGLESLLTLTGRALAGASTSWEYEGGVGILWLGLAVLAPLLANGKVRWQAVVALLLLLYVFGGAVLLQGLPGFRFFRHPSRMLLLVAFPVAYLAGVTTQILFAEPGPGPERLRACRGAILRLLVVILFLQIGYAFVRNLQGQAIQLSVYWLVLPFNIALLLWLTRPAGAALARSGGQPLWLAMLVIDLWTLTGPLGVVRPAAEIFAPSDCVRALVERVREDPGRIVDRGPPGSNASPLWPALPELLGLESVGGFNPTDIRRYKEYLQFITDSDAPLRPPQGDFTFPVLESFPIRNKKLLDLLGVRYLLQPEGLSLEKGGEPLVSTDPRWRQIAADPAPWCFDFEAGGIRRLPPYELYENLEVMPRAFVVHRAEPLPEQALEALKATDFRTTVLLKNGAAVQPVSAPGQSRGVSITRSLPSEIAITVEPGVPGYLVLADLWYPGWTATVNRAPVEVRRANYLFRAVPVPGAACEVVFTFAPSSYERGRLISVVAFAVVGLGLLGGLLAYLLFLVGANAKPPATVLTPDQ